jgi:polyribonucleotide nucleotidyltransferase
MTPNRPAMDYSEIDTAEQLLNAFKQCQNAGEEIQLFESLAERDHPPVDAFVEILRKIKLETVLALAIQAFGKITNDDVKARLKGSEDLLAMLCEQAKSGATDLIRWSAATTIEKVEFAFIDVARYLTEEPSKIIRQTVVSKIEMLEELERKNLRDYDFEIFDNFVVFFTYGERNHAKAKLGIQTIQGLKRRNEKIQKEDVFIGRVTRLGTSGGFRGAFVGFLPGMEGFIKADKIFDCKISEAGNMISNGDEVIVKIQEIDNKGRIFLSCSDSNYDKSTLPNYGI